MFFKDEGLVLNGVNHLLKIEQQQLRAHQYSKNIPVSSIALLTDLKKTKKNLNVSNSPAPSFFEMVGKIFKVVKSVLDLLRLRLKMMSLFLPLFGLTGIIGFIDGLTQRTLRRWQGARESRIIHHRVKSVIFPLLLSSGMCYLALPLSMNPSILFGSFALLFGAVVSIAVRTYKKYL
jgi:integrating conjugative element membrane protein (TIGR03747 family)